MCLKQNSSKFINFHTLASSAMFLCMTITAEQFKVVKVECDSWIVYVGWCNVYLVVDNLTGSVDAVRQTAFTQMPS